MAGYVVLPSNSNAVKFPDNKNSTYKVRLAKRVAFGSQKWEVGLSEIQFPVMWSNVTEGIIWCMIKRPGESG